MGGLGLRGAAGPDDRLRRPVAARRLEPGRGGALPGHHRPRWLAVLEARARARPAAGADPRAARRGSLASGPAMASSSYDVVVIGSGPGGYVAAIRAAQLGLKTAVVEKDDVVGGRCLNYACIPAKAVLRSADVLSEVRDAGEFGIRVNGTEPTVDFDAISERRTKVIGTLTSGVSGLFKKNGIELIAG